MIHPINIDLTRFGAILVNTSAGKDSQTMLRLVVTMAIDQGVLDRVQAVHCDLGRAEWAGVSQLAQEQCDAYDVPLRIIRREKGDLLDQVRARGMWPSSTTRYCTSDQKRDQVSKVFTALTREIEHEGPLQILNCMGLRAQESSARTKRLTRTDSTDHTELNKRATNGKRIVTDWHPLTEWTEEEVWSDIKASGIRHHFAYDLGMPRLSCALCIFAPKAALIIAGRENPELLDEYVEIERSIDHTFTTKMTIESVRDAIEAGATGTHDEKITWSNCA